MQRLRRARHGTLAEDALDTPLLSSSDSYLDDADDDPEARRKSKAADTISYASAAFKKQQGMRKFVFATIILGLTFATFVCNFTNRSILLSRKEQWQRSHEYQTAKLKYEEGKATAWDLKLLADEDGSMQKSMGEDPSLTSSNVEQAKTITTRKYMVEDPSLTSSNVEQATTITTRKYMVEDPSLTSSNVEQATTITRKSMGEDPSLASFNVEQATTPTKQSMGEDPSLASSNVEQMQATTTTRKSIGEDPSLASVDQATTTTRQSIGGDPSLVVSSNVEQAISTTSTLSSNVHVWSPFQPMVKPLMDWELASAGSESDRVCKPPKGIPKSCCLGSFSAGGKVRFEIGSCNNDATVHARVANYTQHFLSTAAHHQMPFSSATQQNITQQQRRPERHDRRGLQQLEASSNVSPPRQDCDICRIVDYLLLRNWTLAIQGDSMSRQTFNGIECELLRRGYMVESTKRKLPRKGSQRKSHWRYGLSDVETLEVSRLPLPPDTGAGSPHPTHTATICYYAIYRPLRDNLEILDIVQQSDIVVFDHGLHWKPPREMRAYEDSMVRLLDAYKRTPSRPRTNTPVDEGGDGKGGGSANSTDAEKGDSIHRLQLVAWRETSPQHFSSSGGHYPKDKHEPKGCVPMHGDMVGPRLARMEAAASRAGFTTLNALDRDFLSQPSAEDELVVLPYRDYASSLHYLHPGDCSHYCHDPHVWLPIWHTLRIAMDRTFRLFEPDKDGP